MKVIVLVIAVLIFSHANGNDCFTKTGVQGTCKVFQECPHFHGIAPGNPTFVAIHGGCENRNGESIFCCPINDISVPPNVIDPKDWPSTLAYVGIFFNKVEAGEASVVEYYLNAGMDVNVTWSDGNTALYAASNNGHLPVVEVLLKAGADPNKTGNKRTTPLYAAARLGYLDVVESLIKAGADVHYKDLHGDTALDAAMREGHDAVVSALVKAGINKDTPI